VINKIRASSARRIVAIICALEAPWY